MEEIINRGAEAYLIKVEENMLKKIREEKPYRNSLLDKNLRKFRAKREFKVLQTLQEKGVNVPKPYNYDKKEHAFTFEFLEGKSLKETITKELLEKSFLQIISMHKQGVIHGDLTTLNMIVVDNEPYIIDFGLAEFSTNKEERAVDLQLFFSSIQNQHPHLVKLRAELLSVYTKKMGDEVVEHLENIVEKRGRNKNK